MASKKSNTSLRLMMASASMIGFLGGWVMLGHAPTPGTVAQTTSTQVTSGTSIRPSQIQSSTGLTQLSAQSVSQRPRLRTGGS